MRLQDHQLASGATCVTSIRSTKSGTYIAQLPKDFTRSWRLFLHWHPGKKERKKEKQREREDPLVFLSPSLVCILLLHGCKSGALGVTFGMV